MADPILPQAEVDTTCSLPTGNEHFPTTAAELATAISDAALNDVIWLDHTVNYNRAGSTFTLPNKTTGSGLIYIIADNYTDFPEGFRVSPADGATMPWLSCNALSEFINCN